MQYRESMDTILSRLRALNIVLRVNEENKLSVKSPKGVITEEIRDLIQLHKEELVDYLHSIEENNTGWKQIPRAIPAVSYPLSSAQQRLWISHELSNASPAYNIPGSLTLEGAYNVQQLEQALRTVVERHEILRTVFREDESGAVRQWIIPAAEVNVHLPCIDMRADRSGAEKARHFIEEDMKRSYDLKQGPLFRMMLFQMEEAKYLLYYNLHHIISDGWSMDILSRDMLKCYEALQQDTAPALPDLRIQYKDYAVWEQEQQFSPVFREHKAYWQEQLSGDLPVLSLPQGKVRPPVLTHNGYSLSTVINESITEKFRTCCLSHNVTLFTGLIAVLKALFYRYTGQEDIIVGTPVAGRMHADLEDQIGFYINTLALRTRLVGTDSFSGLLDKVQQVTLSAFEHQDYPFDRLVEELDLPRDRSHSPITDTIFMFVAEDQRAAGKKERDTTIPEEGTADGEAAAVKIDLHITAREKDGRLYISAQFNTDIYDKKDIEQLLEHYKRLLELVTETPELAINRHDYLSAAEVHRLLHTFNDKVVKYPRDKTIIDLFREQVERAPDNTAVIFEQERLSYRELDERSNRLAHYLKKKGIKEEALVPICIDRSSEMIIAILGILKAGAAFVPIDVSYPRERIAYMLADTGAKLIISHSYFKELYEEQGIATQLLMDRDWIGIEMEPDESLQIPLHPHNLAYVIYTSGSTGKPKGVMIEHKGVVNLSLSMAAALKLEVGTGTLQFASFSFDASCYEIFNTLLSGGFLVLPTRETILSPQSLVSLIDEHNVSVAVLPPSFLSVIKEQPGKLRTIVSAGEPLPAETAKAIQSQGIHLINAYGPTETTVCATLSHHPVLEQNKVTIGGPIANTSIYILDEHKNLLPAGMAGEMYIGGIQVARGYLNREDLTADRFIVSPFRQEERLYRTGDLARWLPDGQIEYMGRTDDQVKLRGHRIELEEIRQALLKIEAVKEAAVMIRTGKANGERFIVAYIVNEVLSTAGIRQELLKHLPEYMVPAYFVRLAQMPLTASGKIDKKQLPAPEDLGQDNAAAYVPPANEIQQKVVELLAGILGKPAAHIGIEDNFFDLGASSLTLIQLTTQLNKEVYTGLRVTTLFEYPNIKSLTENYFEDNIPADTAEENSEAQPQHINEALQLFED